MTTSEVRIRPATGVDFERMLAIYNHVIKTTTAIYTEEPLAPETFRTMMEARQAQGFPILVADIDGAVVGFASFGEFRAWPCYRHSVEHSVHVDEGFRGRGVGKRLVARLCDEAKRLGKHVLIGGIDADNTVSIGLHASLGFERVAHLTEVGRKFDRWLDLVLMQKRLG